MDKISLKANERQILGKKVKKLRQDGIIPGHVFGKNIQTEHVSVNETEFLKVFAKSGESGLINLQIGAEKIRPVLIRAVQVHPVKGNPLHIDFYQVNLTEKVSVTVPIEIIGEEPEIVHSGQAVVIQPLNEIEVEALPAELPEKITVDISLLKAIDDSVLVSQLEIPVGVEVKAEPEAVVVKLDNAVSEDMQKLLEEQAAEQAAAVEATAPTVETTEEGAPVESVNEEQSTEELKKE